MHHHFCVRVNLEQETFEEAAGSDIVDYLQIFRVFVYHHTHL